MCQNYCRENANHFAFLPHSKWCNFYRNALRYSFKASRVKILEFFNAEHAKTLAFTSICSKEYVLSKTGIFFILCIRFSRSQIFNLESFIKTMVKNLVFSKIYSLEHIEVNARVSARSALKKSRFLTQDALKLCPWAF